MLKRIDGGLVLAALGAGGLILSLFLDWYAQGRDAWTVFEINDLVLAALGVLVLVICASRVLGSPRLRAAPEGSISYAGAGALIIVVATLIQPPPSAAHGSPQVGAWLALVASAAIALGGLLLRARVSVVVTLRSRDRDRSATAAVAAQPEDGIPEGPATPVEGEPYSDHEPAPARAEAEHWGDEYPEEAGAYVEEEPTETQSLPEERRG
jgi:hypothetical protein